MPKTIDGKPVNEEKWEKAKQSAKKQGRSDDHKYIMGIYKKMIGMKSFTFQTTKIGYEAKETKDGKKYYVTGFISTEGIDLDNDIVTEECMTDMVAQMKTQNIKLDVDHEAFRDNPNIIPIGRIVSADIRSKGTEKGIWATAELNSASPKFDNVWKSIKTNFIDSFSIAYQPLLAVKKSIGDKVVRLLNKVKLINVALTGNPINPECMIGNVFTKSLDEFKGDFDDLKKEEIDLTETKAEEKKEETEMSEEEKKKKKEEEKKKETKDTETTETKKEDTAAETKAKKEAAEATEKTVAETKALTDKMETMETDMKAMKKKLKAPIMKSTVEDNKKMEEKSEAQGPLSFIQ